MESTVKYVAQSFLWGFVAKILDAGIKFASVPLLLTLYGKNDFGLITLAMSVNAYMSLLDLGLNTGAVKFFAQWISQNKFVNIDHVARTSITFYGVIGVINALILLIVAFFGTDFFNVSSSQSIVLQNLLLILAVFAILNWSSSVFVQLLTANESIYYIHKVSIARSLLNLLLVIAAVFYKLNLEVYFLLFTAVNSLILIPYCYKSRKDGLIKSFMPLYDWRAFSIVLKYSLSIIAIGLFQVSATTLRPIILSIYSNSGIGVVTDYRIMETITIFVISIGSMFTSILLPKISKLILENDQLKVNDFIYNSTKFTSIVCIFLCMPFILCAPEVLTLYVGDKYLYLEPWLSLWLYTVIIFLHSTPVNSMILAKGRTKALVFSTALACILSLVINAFLSKNYGAGSAVLGYFVYIIIQMSFYYFYFNSKILDLDSKKVFKAYIVPTMLGLFCMGAVKLFDIKFDSLMVQAISKTMLWTLIYSVLLFAFKILNFKLIFKQVLS